MQLVFTDKGLREQSKLDKLILLRKHYYTELERTINLLRIQKIQALQSFKNVCIDIDKEIEKEKHKARTT
jgi:hypothetical protein